MAAGLSYEDEQWRVTTLLYCVGPEAEDVLTSTVSLLKKELQIRQGGTQQTSTASHVRCQYCGRGAHRKDGCHARNATCF